MANAGHEVLINIDDITTAGVITSPGAADAAGVQGRTLTRNRGELDITSDDDGGWRKLSEKSGTKSVDLSYNGVTLATNRDKLLNLFYASEATRAPTTCRITWPDPDGTGALGTKVEEGDFFLQSLEFSAESGGFIAFSVTLLSSGEVTLT